MSIPTEILEFLKQGESETLEFKTRVRDPLLIARLIAGFANNQGGHILIGVKEPPEVVGVDRTEVERVFTAATKLLEPAAEVSVSYVGSPSTEVAVIVIRPAKSIVYVQGAAFIRTGEFTKPMAWTQMLKHLPPKSAEANIEALLQESQKQTSLLEKLLSDNEQLRESNESLNAQVAKLNDPAARNKERLIGGAIGVGASLVAAFLWLIATKQITWLRT